MHPKNWGFDECQVKKIAREVLRDKNLDDKVALSLVFIGKKRARDLNQKYRGKNYIPQVLGFPMSQEIDVDGQIHLGDVVICSGKLKYEIKYQKKTSEIILRDWIKHGVENLLK